MGGRACVRGLRVTVGMIVGQIGAGVGLDELLVDYPYLERQDVMQALRYAAWRAEEREVVLTGRSSTRHFEGKREANSIVTDNSMPNVGMDRALKA